MSSAQNIAYRVELTERASLDIESIFDSISAADSLAAANWHNGLEDAVFSLDHLPDRGTRTDEDHELRQLIYGNKPHFYRIIYAVDHKAKKVLILHIRHGARSAFQPQDL